MTNAGSSLRQANKTSPCLTNTHRKLISIEVNLQLTGNNSKKVTKRNAPTCLSSLAVEQLLQTWNGGRTNQRQAS